MGKLVAIYVTVMVFLCGFIGVSINSLSSQYEQEKAVYESKIGDEYIFSKDTLTIMDYSTFNETFTLSNGVEVNNNLIIKNK